MIRIRRNYRAWVANETLEDYSLRYAARSYRKWSPYLLASTALGGISFLALEAIGAAITISAGFANAFPAIIVAVVLIFAICLPITYYAGRYNIDMDLLTRGAGFGYIGSTITSLIYASFTFIFFALEAAIMAQAIELYFGLPIAIGYVLCSLVIIPITFFGVTLINRLQLWTLPVWAVLFIAPFWFVFAKEPALLSEWSEFAGRAEHGGGFDFLLFGAATGVLFSLVAQVGEQVDYLRFLPDRTRQNRWHWWAALICAGPGWILLGGAKILAGSLLAYVVVRHDGSFAEAVEPVRMYIEAYEFMFDDAALVVLVATVFVIVSQVKINVTNAYAGSLAWGNFFSRVTHYHPGRVTWLVFNVLIALLLMLLGIFETLEAVLSVYANVASAWVGALVADLVVLKPLGISPPYIEFKRAHLHDINPVGCGAMALASLLSIAAFFGAFGIVAQVYSAFLSLIIAFAAAILIAWATKGRYYIAREDPEYRDVRDAAPVACCICRIEYEPADMANCPFYEGPICSLCCTLDSHCHDVCKEAEPTLAAPAAGRAPPSLAQPTFRASVARRVWRFVVLFCVLAVIAGALFLLSFRLLGVEDMNGADLSGIFQRLYAGSLVLFGIAAWWLVLQHESRELAESELVNSLHHLEMTRKELVQSEKMASLGALVSGVAHEINTPVGISVSAASFLQDRTRALRRRLDAKGSDPVAVRDFLDDAEESARLLLSNAGRAADLIQSFKQVSVDRVSEQHRGFDLRDYLEETVASLRPELRHTRHRVQIDCPEGLALEGYPGALAQALSNLVMNSLRHAWPPGAAGTLRLEARLGEDDIVELCCSDDGRGVPPEVRDKLFEPFFTTIRGEGGSGLGLYIVYNIVTQTLGGSIDVETDTGTGITFRLAQRSPAAAPWTALIVDDDPAVHEVTRILMARASFENRRIALHHAYSAEEARCFLALHPETALVLLDVVMESDDAGLRLCGHIRESLDNHDVQIVLRTGQPGQAPEREVILDYEINGYFLKTELTAQKLHSIFICALRTWNYIQSLKRRRGAVNARAAHGEEPERVPGGIGRALERNEVELLAQPQLSLPHGGLAGVELIPIWRRDAQFTLPGVRLLRAADREGETGRLHRWLIAESCRLARRWCEDMRSLPKVSLKASGAALRSGDLVAVIRRCLEETPLPSRRLALEIPENELCVDLGASARTAERLRALGVAITVDEFGIGPTSIAELRQLEPTALKIAPEVVVGVASDPDCAAVARSVIALAHTLGMSVIAEGVETTEQLEFLKWEDCESVQGDFFAEAMSPARLDAFLDSDWNGLPS